jgi:8-oxo-dGTP pyrophosphatase MutT (NUDIX family)
MGQDVEEVSKVIIKCNDRMLFLQKNNKEWELPGGHLNEGENFIQGAVREVFEETGIKLKKLKPVLTQKMFNMFACKIKISKVKLSDEHVNYKWVTSKSIKKLVVTKSTRENWKHILSLF